MAIKLDKDAIESIQKHFNDPSTLHVARIVVNNEKRALIFSTVPVGELFSSTTDKKKGTKSLIIDIETENEINAD